MKCIRRIVLLLTMVSLLFTGKEAYADNSLQAKIDSIPAGGILKLKKGSYHERIVLKKPIQLVGEKGTIFTACTSKPVIIIKGENVKIKGINIKNCHKKSSSPVIYITGKKHQIEYVTIHSGRVAVKLDNAENIALKNVEITGDGQERGIDLWDSSFNLFSGIKLDHVQDGFYMENSHYNTFFDNSISDSRYGLHIMFSDNITIKKNSSFHNFTGAMVMDSNNTIIEANKLTDNNQNVNAQGLLLYDVHHSVIHDNLISANRVGMYIEDSSSNKIFNNIINANFIGAQLNKINNNQINRNSFYSNVSEVQAIQSTHNNINNNYWDASSKLDSDGDGYSNLAYRADPYFLNLIGEVPEYQLFFQDPGMLLLQKMLKTPDKLLITDEFPLMKSGIHTNTQAEENERKAWILCLAMIMGSLLLIIKGRKKL